MAKVTTAAESESKRDSAELPPENDQSKYRHERLPLPHSLNLKFPELRDYWKPIYEKHGPRVWGYLFRYFPRIIKPKPHYIDKFIEPLEDEKEILQKWGAGEYEIRLYDTDVKRGNELCRCRFKFNESYSERPPVLDPLELEVGHEANRGYIEWRRSQNLPVPGDLNRNGAPQGNDIAVKTLSEIALKKQEPESLDTSAASAAFKIVAQASTHAIETVKAQSDPTAVLKIVEAVKGNGASEFITTLIKFQADAATQQTALVTKLLDRPNQNNGLIELIVKIQADASAQQTALTKSMFDLLASQKKTEESSSGSMGRLRETVETIASVAELFGGRARASNTPGWVDAVFHNPAVNRLTDAVGGALVNWSQAYMMSQGGRGGQTAAVPPAAGREPTPGPDGVVHYPGEAAPSAGPPTEEQMSQQFLIEFFLPRAASFMNAIEKGISGDDFAERLFEIDELDPLGSGMTLGQHAQIKSIGKDKLVSLLGMASVADPRLRQVLAGKQTLVMQFLEQFLNWEPTNEADTDVPPPPAFEAIK